VAVALCGVTGLLGLVHAVLKQTPGKVFRWATWIAIGAILVQVALGVTAMNAEQTDPGNQHVFYGIVIAFTMAFTYIYRAQLEKRPALRYGLLMLFVMGLGIRGIMTFGKSF
jgi:hypothetical protein